MTTKRMLVDASHPEETRIVITSGNKLDEFDFEAANRRQLRGNIYLAKVTRVEPSLQAAFVEYGGNRHGFLAFSEIHPDYYQIPKADREALLRAEAEIISAQAKLDAKLDADGETDRDGETDTKDGRQKDNPETDGSATAGPAEDETALSQTGDPAEESGNGTAADAAVDETDPAASGADPVPLEATGESKDLADSGDNGANGDAGDGEIEENDPEDDDIEDLGSVHEELLELRRAQARRYKIQEVIKRRQVLLIQVVKEERGNKGAALTTYLSLAGRYSVLMPNTARGGGISRKITSSSDRKRLKKIASELSVPPGMGVILRTAGASRTKAEIKRDFEYLSRLWENVRKLTLQSSAPSLVYEEGSLIKRTIRDLYNKDISEVLVSGEAAYHEAKDFMRLIMPSHAKNVKLHKEAQNLFSRYGVEAQLDSMFSPQVTLPSGGYIVINPTEALVSIDVNSGRATREQNIEATALQTNLEAAEEAARQFRLRDLAGLIVIDFIDMNERRSIKAVEKRLKDALKNDRARIQVGRISNFGLLEMSRQRMRSGVLESSTHACPTCEGTGIIRGVESRALMVMRAVEDQVVRKNPASIEVRAPSEVALYMLNAKRAELTELENSNNISITIISDPSKTASDFSITRAENRPETARSTGNSARAAASSGQSQGQPSRKNSAETAGDNDNQPKRKRRRKKTSGSQQASENNEQIAQEAGENGNAEQDPDAPGSDESASPAQADSEDQPRKRRRRGRRGGRRNRRNSNGDFANMESPDTTADASAPRDSSHSSPETGPVEKARNSTDRETRNADPESQPLNEGGEQDNGQPGASPARQDEKPATARARKPARRRGRNRADEDTRPASRETESSSPAAAPQENRRPARQDKPAGKGTPDTSATGPADSSSDAPQDDGASGTKKQERVLPEEGTIISTSNTETAPPARQRKGWWSR